jgi:predicted CXXCH cytochrome family protein
MLAGLVTGSVGARGVVDSAHNLSASGPGQVRAASEARVCEFCHTPHNSSPQAALWNRRSPGTTYTPYTSSTAMAAPGQPTGSSVLCLSCHDGTVALGDVLSRNTPIAMAGGSSTIPPGRAKTGTDLRHHHPVSFVYDANLAGRRGELTMPSALPKDIRLDRAGQMQCTSCHDAHDDSFGDFLVMPNSASALCVQCHRKNEWSSSSHGQSGAGWNGQGRNPWPHSDESTVSGNACRNCHETHQTGGGPLLLRHDAEEDNCADCHNGNVAHKDVMASFKQFSSHPVSETARAHDAGESAVISNRHVECSDCHDPHASPTGGARPAGPGAAGRRPKPKVRGVDLNNAEMRPATRGYQVCLRCHGDSPGKGKPRVRRQLDQNNIRLEIQPGNPSFHPIAGPGRNQDVPSLISPLTTQSIMDCVDCHNSSAVGGLDSEPSGPHGSSIEPILALNYETTDNTPESPSAYALCYSCHSRNSILNDESFQGHDLHIREQRTPCSVCHDAHGVSATQGNSTNNSHLINFDTTIVQPNSQGILRYNDQGRYRGSCDLLCHGRDHQTEGY